MPIKIQRGGAVDRSITAGIPFRFRQPERLSRRSRPPGYRATHKVKFQYIPVLLGGIYKATGNMSPAESLRGIENKPEYQGWNPSASSGATVSPSSTAIRSSRSTRLCSCAALSRLSSKVCSIRIFRGGLPPYVGRAEEDGRPRSLPPRPSNPSGIDIDRLIARAQQDDVKQKLIKDTNDAVARGSFGSPTFFVGNEIFFGKDSLRDVEEAIVEQASFLKTRTAWVT